MARTSQCTANVAAAVVLSTRFYLLVISIKDLTFRATHVMISPIELANRVRWTAISSSEVPHIVYAFSGGVHCGKGLIKSILAGATAVEVCSAIYQYGNKTIEEMKNELTTWMDENEYETIGQFKGKMNAAAAGEIKPFERTQFMKYYSNHEE